MSGGSCDYVCYKIEEHLVGNMQDAELDELMQDVANLAHALEWYLSSDTNEEHYRTEARCFKKKWFNGNRNERLKGYIDKRIESAKQELYKMISEV